MTWTMNPFAKGYIGTVLHGPAPAPKVIRSPRVHVITSSSPYDASQTMDGIGDGDILLCGETVAVMCQAWPVLVVGEEGTYGFHSLVEGASLVGLGANGWGRLFPATPLSPDGDYSPIQGGGDYTEPFAIARRLGGTTTTMTTR